MNNQNKKFRAPFRIRSYEVGSSKTATLSAVCNYFQEAAGIHANKLDFDISSLQEKGLTWVLYKMHVKMHSFPRRWDQTEVITWPAAGDGLRAYRDYELRDDKGSLLGVALSQWMVLNLKTRRPVRMPHEIKEMGLQSNHHVLEVDKSPVPGIENPDPVYVTTAGRHDLDMNDHVNNVRYIDWITGYTPGSFIPAGMTCTELDVQYVSEAVAGDKIYLAQKPDTTSETGSKTLRHTLYRNDPDHVIANAVTCWEQEDEYR